LCRHDGSHELSANPKKSDADGNRLPDSAVFLDQPGVVNAVVFFGTISEDLLVGEEWGPWKKTSQTTHFWNPSLDKLEFEFINLDDFLKGQGFVW